MLAGHKAALQYARQHFARFKDSNMPVIQRLMGSLCYIRRQSSSPYAEFNSPAQWDDVAHEFTRQCCGLLGQVHFYLSVDSQNERKEKCMLFSDHKGSLLRRKPRVC